MLKKLLTGVLALTLVANVAAQNTQETQVANFIEAARVLGVSDADIVKAFEASLVNADENAVTDAFNKLNADQKKVLAGVVAASVVALAVAGYMTRDGKVPFKAVYNKLFGPAAPVVPVVQVVPAV